MVNEPDSELAGNGGRASAVVNDPSSENGGRTVGASPGVVALSPDGATAYVASNSGNSLSVIDTETKSVTATIELADASFSFGVAFGPRATPDPSLDAEIVADGRTV